jgi:hypothetical protein
MGTEYLLKILVRELVALLELPIALGLLLHGVVGEVDESVLDVLHRELLTRRAEVALLK